MNSTVVMTATMEGMVAAATKVDTKLGVSGESSKFIGDSEPDGNSEPVDK